MKEKVIPFSDNDRAYLMPILQLPGTSLKLSAFTMMQKRVAQGEDINAILLFDAFCDSIEKIRAPKRSLLGRLFGPRLT